MEIIPDNEVVRYINRHIEQNQYQRSVTPYILFYARRDTRQIQLPTAENWILQGNIEENIDGTVEDNHSAEDNNSRQFPKDLKSRTKRSAERKHQNHEKYVEDEDNRTRVQL